MAKLGKSLGSFRQTGRVTGGTDDAVEDAQAARRYNNTAPVTRELTVDTVKSTREAAAKQMLDLEDMGLEGSDEFRRAKEIFETGGAQQGKGFLHSLGTALDLLDRPAHLLRLGITDMFGIDRSAGGTEITGADYWDAVTGNYEDIAQRHGALTGKDGHLYYGEVLSALGWKKGQDDNLDGFFGVVNDAAHGVAGFGLDALIDPINLGTLGLGGAMKKTALVTLNTAIQRGVTRGVALEFGESAARKGLAKGVEKGVTAAAREGTESVAMEAAKRLRVKLDAALAEMGDDATDEIIDLTQQRLRTEVHEEMLGEAMQPLAKKRFDQLPDWIKEDSDVVPRWIKGGLRGGFMGGSRNAYRATGRVHDVTAGRRAQLSEAVGSLLRKSNTAGKGLDRLAKVQVKAGNLVSSFNPVVQGAKAGHEWAPKAIRLMAETADDATTVAMRRLQQRSGLAMSKMANQLKDEAKGDVDAMGRIFTEIFEITNNGRMIGVNADRLASLPESQQKIAEEFAAEWTSILDDLAGEARRVGILDANQTIENYVPAITSQEFRKFAEQTAETGLRIWDDNAPEELKEGLAWLNELVVGIQRRTGGAGRRVAGETEFANERALGRGVTVTDINGSFLLNLTEATDVVYAPNLTMNEKMMAALDWAIDQHNAAPIGRGAGGTIRTMGDDPARRITKPKWLEDWKKLDDKAAAVHGVMELDPAKSLNTYVRSMTDAINERRIAERAEEIGMLSRENFEVDVARVAHRIRKQFAGLQGKTEKQLERRLRKLAAEKESAAKIANREPTMYTVKIGDQLIEIPRAARNDPVIQNRIARAKEKAKIRDRIYRVEGKRAEERARKLRAQGVSDELADQMASAPLDEVKAIYDAVFEWQRQEVASKLGVAMELAREETDNAVKALAIKEKAAADAAAELKNRVRVMERLRQSMETEWNRRGRKKLRIRFDTMADRRMLVHAFRENYYGQLATMADYMPDYRRQLMEVAELVRTDDWANAEAAIKRFSDEIFSEGSDWAQTKAKQVQKSLYGKRRTQWGKWFPPKTKAGKNFPFSQANWTKLKSQLEQEMARTGKVPDDFRDVWEGMKRIELEEQATARTVDEIAEPMITAIDRFTSVMELVAKLERGDGSFNPKQRTLFLEMMRESGVLQRGQYVEWDVKGARFGVQIRDMREWVLPSLADVEKEIKAAGFRTIDQARRASDIAQFETADDWMEYQAAIWGMLDEEAKDLTYGNVPNTAAAREARIQANWEGEMKHHWDKYDPINLDLIETTDLGDGMILRHERTRSYPYEEAVAWRNAETGELYGYISAVPRATDDYLINEGPKWLANGEVWVAIDPSVNKLHQINGKRPIIGLREKAEELFMPTFAGTGGTSYHFEGALSVWKSARKQVEGLSEETRQALLRGVDDIQSGYIAEAQHAIADQMRITRSLQADHAAYAKSARKLKAVSDRMAMIQRELNKENPSWKRIDNYLAKLNEEAAEGGVAPGVEAAILRFKDQVEVRKIVESDQTAFLAGRAQQAQMMRAAYFDDKKAAESIKALVDERRAAELANAHPGWEEAENTLDLLAAKMQQIFGFADPANNDGTITRYMSESVQEEFQRLLDDASKLWDKAVGPKGNPFSIQAGDWTPAPNEAGWASTSARGLGGQGLAGMGGDAQAVAFLDNFIGKHLALGSPQGFREITGMWMQALNWWKTAATVMRLPFHTRNFISAMWANQMGNVGPNEYFHSAQLFKPNGFFHKLILRGEGIDAAAATLPENLARAARDAYDQGLFFESFAEQEIAQRLLQGNATRGKALPARVVHDALSSSGKVARAGGHAMQGVEMYHRFAAFLKFYEPGLEGSARNAASWAHTIHFDYTDLTSFERDVIKKFVPFYVWAKNNLPLQLRLMTESPGMLNRYNFLVNEFRMSEEDPNMPGASWRNTPYARIGDLEGAPDDFFSRAIWSPDVGLMDLFDVGMSPKSVMLYMVNSLGPQFDLLSSAGEDYKVDAPGGLNAVLRAVSWVPGVQAVPPTGLKRISPIARTAYSTLLPFASDYIDPAFEMSPARLERLGTYGGVEESDVKDSVMRMFNKNILGGLGFSAEGEEAAYRTGVSASFELQENLTNLRKQGYIDPELEATLDQSEELARLFPEG